MKSEENPIFNLDYDALLEEYSPLAYSICNQYKNAGLPLEDLQQEALLGLLEAANSYDATKGAKFSTYAVWHIKKRILSALKKEMAHSLQAETFEDNQITVNNEEVHIKSSDWEKIIPSEMPPLEARLYSLLSNQEGLTLKEIAKNLDLTVERVKQIRNKAIRRIKREQESLTSSISTNNNKLP
jgi:RNA polymerase primary sigma factor